MKIGCKKLLKQAQAEIETISVEEANKDPLCRAAQVASLGYLGHPEYVFVDLRDIREPQREGKIPGAFHAPWGMLEFWVDPPTTSSPLLRAKNFVFYYTGGWRSALAA